jgi:hypothetical protein
MLQSSSPSPLPAYNETSGLSARLERASPYVLSVLRFMAALLFLEHGLSKFFGFPARTTAGFLPVFEPRRTRGPVLLRVPLFHIRRRRAAQPGCIAVEAEAQLTRILLRLPLVATSL